MSRNMPAPVPPHNEAMTNTSGSSVAVTPSFLRSVESTMLRKGSMARRTFA